LHATLRKNRCRLKWSCCCYVQVRAREQRTICCWFERVHRTTCRSSSAFITLSPKNLRAWRGGFWSSRTPAARGALKGAWPLRPYRRLRLGGRLQMRLPLSRQRHRLRRSCHAGRPRQRGPATAAAASVGELAGRMAVLPPALLILWLAA